MTHWLRVLAACLVFALCSGTALAQAPAPISEIRIEGNQRIERETILSYLALTPGQPADPARINIPGVLFVLFVFVVGATALFGPLAACLVELFPTRVRYTALSLPYHIGTGWVGGFVPFTAFAIVTTVGDLYAGLWFPFVFTAISVATCLLFLPETKGRPLDA